MNFGPDGAGDGRFYRTARSECMFDGGVWQFHGNDENGLCRSLNGKITGVHKVLCSAGATAMRMHFERLMNYYGRKPLNPVHIEDNIFNFYLGKEVKSTGTCIVSNSLQPGNDFCESEEILNTDPAPLGDDIEPSEALREDVEMGNDEDEKPLEAEVPRARMNPGGVFVQ